MPARTDGSTKAVLLRSSLQIPDAVMVTMRKDPRSNFILSTIDKRRAMESKGQLIGEDEFWIVCYTERQTSQGPKNDLDFVLACTFGVMGPYPVFIYGTRLTSHLSEEYLEVPMRKLVQTLFTEALPTVAARRRVYSVFAVSPVAQIFARKWKERTGIDVEQELYYDAKFSYCQENTLSPPLSPSRQDHSHYINMRPAGQRDIVGASHLCHGFASESPPFELSEQDAIAECAKLVRAGQLWVLETTSVHAHALGEGRTEPEIACIVALTRSTQSVTTITKVYTPPKFRKRGYAYMLVQAVCQHLFTVERKAAVVLYVGNDNPARHVYRKVGFVGLGSTEEDKRFEAVEDWLEIGFDRSKVDLGHW